MLSLDCLNKIIEELIHNPLELLLIALAYIYCIKIGDCLISSIIESLWKLIKPNRTDYEKKQVKILGMIEGVLYLSAFLFNIFSFVPVWLTLKTVSRWVIWQEKNNGRKVFNIFLMGNGLRIIICFASFLMIRLAISISFPINLYFYFAVAIVPVIFICCLKCVIHTIRTIRPQPKNIFRSDIHQLNLKSRRWHNFQKG
jgi:hypothetical protein